ncbi:MAG: type III pantothenate kinase [Deltaproteobacteria bacterium]|nr:MAG: type III pantothenate kinase [Deltaproteobacteria bacterium]
MLLVIDIGNTTTVLGVFQDDRLVGDWRLTTTSRRTTDEIGILVLELFRFAGIRPTGISGIILSCVVPPLLAPFTDACKRYFRVPPLVVGPGIRTGMPILARNPREVGADRIVNAVAAYERYHEEVIVVDFGTATTFDFVSGRGEYMGGVICPGMMISLDALYHRASKLPRVEFAKPKSVIGKDTIHSMQSGIYYGYVGLVDEIVTRMIEEVDAPHVHVIATGGYADRIGSESKTIETVDPHLTLEGLKILFERNQG